ncbi:hypothetical protein CF386_09745 [Paraphotobacterium marinum]|uniref:Uncharacterized protein n=1 Tax=Paraphotobacterium marinum TaxID=1755811 RepID=A0A220VFZ3_9GAMM|nr:hypothetical protein [Paraphotobacterium marinum]ASK79338.1 hypothetical protein CF386_09745 [Paraphotobacterium marinum]
MIYDISNILILIMVLMTLLMKIFSLKSMSFYPIIRVIKLFNYLLFFALTSIIVGSLLSQVVLINNVDTLSDEGSFTQNLMIENFTNNIFVLLGVYFVVGLFCIFLTIHYFRRSKQNNRFKLKTKSLENQSSEEENDILEYIDAHLRTVKKN